MNIKFTMYKNIREAAPKLSLTFAPNGDDDW